MPSLYRNIEVMKKLLLIILLLSQPIYANSNEMSKFIIPHVTICDFDDPYPYNLVDLEREITEFEAKLAKELVDKAAQEIMPKLNHPPPFSDCTETEPLHPIVDIEREIAEFEAKLAKELADKAAQEIMAEIEAEAKLPKLQPTVCEPNSGGYEAYILGIKN